MTQAKLHIIEPDFQADIITVVQRRDNLGHEIAQLAAKIGETIHFHDYTDPVAGAPVVMLECSDDFFEQVKNLPDVANAYDFNQNMATQRNAGIKSFFNSDASKKQKQSPKPRNPKPKF